MEPINILIIALGESIAILLIICYLLYVYSKRIRTENKKLRKLLRDQRNKWHISEIRRNESQPTIGGFLKKELIRTKKRLAGLSLAQTENDPDTACKIKLAAVRKKFLEAELQAESYHENQHAFWVTMENALQDLVKALMERANSAEKSEDRENYMALIEQYKNTIADLSQYKDEYGSVTQALSTAKQHIEQLESDIMAGTLNLKNYPEFQDINQKTTDFEGSGGHKTGLNQDIFSNSEALDNFIESVQTANLTYHDSFDNHIENLTRFNTVSDNELKRLREICGEQKNIIDTLRQRIEKEAKNPQSETSLIDYKEIKALQAMLKEYDICVITLEQETRNLHSTIESLKLGLQEKEDHIKQIMLKLKVEMEKASALASIVKSQEDNHDTNNNAEINSLSKKQQQTITEYKNQNRLLQGALDTQQKNNLLYQEMMAFIEKLIGVSSLNDLSRLLLSTLSTQNKNALLLIKTGNEKVTGSNIRNKDEKDINILNCMEVSQKTLALKSDIIVSIPPIRLILKNVAKNSVITEKEIVNWTKELTTAAAIKAEMLSKENLINARKVQQKNLTEKLKESIINILVQSKYIKTEAIAIQKKLWDEIDLAVSIVDMTATQKSRFEEIVNEGQSRFDLLFQTSDTTKRSVEALLKELEDSVKK
jgi:hypothetical protein